MVTIVKINYLSPTVKVLWWFFPPLEREINSFTLYDRFQQREGQKIETERTFVNIAQLAHREREKRKEVSIC